MKTAPSDLDSLYRTHFSDVHRFVFHFVQNPALADELTQDAFLKAYEAWGSFRGEAPERIWLLRIARNVCLDYLRSARARQTKAVLLDEGGEVATAPGREPPLTVDQAARRAEMTDCVQQFVLSLTETLRTPLILHDMEGPDQRADRPGAGRLPGSGQDAPSPGAGQAARHDGGALRPLLRRAQRPVLPTPGPR